MKVIYLFNILVVLGLLSCSKDNVSSISSQTRNDSVTELLGLYNGILTIKDSDQIILNDSTFDINVTIGSNENTVVIDYDGQYLKALKSYSDVDLIGFTLDTLFAINSTREFLRVPNKSFDINGEKVECIFNVANKTMSFSYKLLINGIHVGYQDFEAKRI